MKNARRRSEKSCAHTRRGGMGGKTRKRAYIVAKRGAGAGGGAREHARINARREGVSEAREYVRMQTGGGGSERERAHANMHACDSEEGGKAREHARMKEEGSEGS